MEADIIRELKRVPGYWNTHCEEWPDLEQWLCKMPIDIANVPTSQSVWFLIQQSSVTRSRTAAGC